MPPHRHEALRKRNVQPLLPSVWQEFVGGPMRAHRQAKLREGHVPELLLQLLQPVKEISRD